MAATTGKPDAAPASRGYTTRTVICAVIAVLVTPLALLTATGLLAPIGILAGLIAVTLAVVVLARTRTGGWPRRFSWGLVAFSLTPWALTIAFYVWISFVDNKPVPPLP